MINYEGQTFVKLFKTLKFVFYRAGIKENNQNDLDVNDYKIF